MFVYMRCNKGNYEQLSTNLHIFIVSFLKVIAHDNGREASACSRKPLIAFMIGEVSRHLCLLIKDILKTMQDEFNELGVYA